MSGYCSCLGKSFTEGDVFMADSNQKDELDNSDCEGERNDFCIETGTKTQVSYSSDEDDTLDYPTIYIHYMVKMR